MTYQFLINFVKIILKIIIGSPRIHFRIPQEFILHPWHVLVPVLSEWINREQEKAIAYLRADIIDFGEELGRTKGDIQHRERLGGMLRYYYRDAA